MKLKIKLLSGVFAIFGLIITINNKYALAIGLKRTLDDRSNIHSNTAKWDPTKRVCAPENFNPMLIEAVKNKDLITANKWLVRGVNPNVYDENLGLSALHLATTQNDINMVNLLIRHGANPNITDSNNMAPLHYAAMNNNVAITDFLIRHGANLYATDLNGKNPLQYAIECHCTAFIMYITNMFDNIPDSAPVPKFSIPAA